MKSNAEREFVDSMREMAMTPSLAADVQRLLDWVIGERIPTGEAREVSVAELMPFERRALFGDGFEDTQPIGRV